MTTKSSQDKVAIVQKSITHSQLFTLLLSEEIISLKSTKRKIVCDCMPNCDNTNFFIQSIVSRLIKIESVLITPLLCFNHFSLPQRSRIWFLGANFQWGIIDYPKLQLKRELLFGISDVLGEFDEAMNSRREIRLLLYISVYVGGLGGLFLGKKRLSVKSCDSVSTLQAARCSASPNWCFSSRGA